MPLRLQVISAHRESMGGSYIQEFAACGGTIGRSLECDWPLPDSKRFVSSRHAMIDFQGGAYYLVDLSRNGVFVNGSNEPVGKGKPQRLFDGDTLRIGEFEIQAALIEDADESEDGMRDSIVRAQLVKEDESLEIAMLEPDSIDDDLQLEEFLKPGDESGELSALLELPAEATARLRKMTEQQILADLMQEFLTAAGVRPEDFDGIEPKNLLMNAGHLLREYTNGTHRLLLAKDKIAKELGDAASDPQASANPLRASDSLQNAVRLLLGRSNDVNQTGAGAVQEAFRELERHQQGIVRAMRKAPEHFDAEFSAAYTAETDEQAS